MDKVMEQLMEVLTNPRMHEEFLSGTWETIYSTVLATAVACLLGMVLGVLLVVGERDGVRPLPAPVMKVLNLVINILRSVPFLILMLMVLPLSKVLVGTRVGTIASIPPLIIAAAPFVARLVEAALREVDKGVLEAAQAMGCSPVQIVWKVIRRSPPRLSPFSAMALWQAPSAAAVWVRLPLTMGTISTITV